MAWNKVMEKGINKSVRKRIFEIIEVSQENDKLSFAYDLFMLISIIISIIPLAYKQAPGFFTYTDYVTTVIFIVDYCLRLFTADLKLNRKGVIAFIRYPFTFWAIVDLLSILPGLSILSSGFKLFRIFRVFRTFRIFRVFKAIRYSKNIDIIVSVIKKQKEALIAVCFMAVGYILISALIIFNVESESFNSFFDAIYWATVSLTTVGYGDIYPVSTAGRIITMLSSIFGIAIVALPAGIITAGFMDTIYERNGSEDNKS